MTRRALLLALLQPRPADYHRFYITGLNIKWPACKPVMARNKAEALTMLGLTVHDEAEWTKTGKACP